MHIILEYVDGQIYGDIILSPKEMDLMSMGEMVDGMTIFDRKKCYIGVRLRGRWETDEKEEFDFDSDETC